jgi:acetyl esterase/lipase
LWQGLEAVWEWYLSPNPKLEGKATVCQWEDELETYPPTLSLAGSYDPLGLCESTREFDAMLKRKGVPSTFTQYEATHGFIGYPPSMQQALAGGDGAHWKENCAQATEETVAFLVRHHGQNRRTRILGG